MVSRSPSIDVRCSCGRKYHADPAHVGRSIRCRCGKILPIPPQSGSGELRRANSLARWVVRRFHRIRAAPGLLTPSPVLRRYATRITFGYLAAIVGFTLVIWTLGDRWWPATALLFGPRWLVLVPAPLLGLAALLVRPGLFVPLGSTLVVALGPGMGYRVGFRDWLENDRRDVRIVTYNIDAGPNPRVLEIPLDLERLEPDVMIFQECDSRLVDTQYWPTGWVVRFDQGMCLGSKYPITATAQEERVATGDLGGTGNAQLYRLKGPRGTIDLVSVHLETPRKGLETLRYGGDLSRINPSTFVRDIGSRRISRWIASQSHDAIVAGDFNMPVESAIYRRYWSTCRNAFSNVGHGFGYTRILKHFAVRIDHVLTCGSWRPVRAHVGPDLGSDHLPLIVDLRQEGPGRP